MKPRIYKTHRKAAELAAKLGQPWKATPATQELIIDLYGYCPDWACWNLTGYLVVATSQDGALLSIAR